MVTKLFRRFSSDAVIFEIDAKGETEPEHKFEPVNSGRELFRDTVTGKYYYMSDDHGGLMGPFDDCTSAAMMLVDEGMKCSQTL